VNAELHTLTGAYALHALDVAERARFEDHLAQCAACRKEVAELQQTAARLGVAVDARPPEQLRAQVLAAARRVRQLPPADARLRPAPSRNWPLWLTSVAAAAAVVTAVLLGVQVSRVDDRLSETTQLLDELGARQDALVSVLAAPDAEVRSTRGALSATVVVSERQDRLVFLPRRVPAPRSGETYQLWLIGPDGARSAGVFAQAGRPLEAESLGAAEQVGVTVEPAGGSPQPTSDPILQLRL
jgi:anti-sigma factor RsiW